MSAHVLELVASSRGGGAAHVRDLALGLDSARFCVLVAMPEDGGNVTPDDFETAGIPFRRMDIAEGLSLQALRQIRRMIRDADILHVHGARAALFGRLAAISLGSKRPRLVYTIHGYAAPYYRQPKRHVLLSLERCLAGVTDAWVCVSNAEKGLLLATGVADPEHVHVIWNGIHVERFVRVREQREEIRRAINVPPDAFLVTTVGRLHPMPHDFRTLLTAFAHVWDMVPEAHLLIVGDGPLRAEIKQMVAVLGLEQQAHLIGMRRDVPQILRATDVFVLSSREWTGFPLTVLEAMASSLPVVSSDVSGTRESVLNGQTGYLFPPGNALVLAHCVQALAGDRALARLMGQRGLARVRELFSVQRMVRETAALYGQLLA